MTNNAIILTDGNLHKVYGKTAHGLITARSRYPIRAVVDINNVGKDAGVVTDGKPRNIPIYATIEQAYEAISPKPTHVIIGVATPGGYLTPTLLEAIRFAITKKLCVVNGLHELISEHPQLKPLIEKYHAQIVDIRKPKDIKDLHKWHGDITKISTPRIAVLGMDCAIGKRTTAELLYQLCNENKIKAQMIYTGQTGWLQGFEYGFIFDSTLNDFVSGELEYAILSCVKAESPDLVLLEGQSSLRNPSGPCGAEFICSGGAKGVILHHPVGRQYFNHGDEARYPLPSLAEEIALIRLYGAEVLAITLNTREIDQETWQQAKIRIQQETGLTVVCPREESIAELLPIVKLYIEKKR